MFSLRSDSLGGAEGVIPKSPLQGVRREGGAHAFSLAKDRFSSCVAHFAVTPEYLQAPFEKPLSKVLVLPACIGRRNICILNLQQPMEAMSMFSKAALVTQGAEWMLVFQYTEIKEDQESLLRDKVFL